MSFHISRKRRSKARRYYKRVYGRHFGRKVRTRLSGRRTR